MEKGILENEGEMNINKGKGMEWNSKCSVRCSFTALTHRRATVENKNEIPHFDP